MILVPGARLRSAVCSGQVVVVRAPAADVDLRLGGVPPHPAADPPPVGAVPDPAFVDELPMGKRYADAESGLEVLVTRAGSSVLSVGDRRLDLLHTKALPASD